MEKLELQKIANEVRKDIVTGQRRYCGGLLMLFRGCSDNLHRFFRFACYSKSISMRRGG